QLGEVLLDARGDEVARALAAHQQALLDQAVERLSHRDARNRELGRDLALRRKGVVGRQQPPFDRLPQRPLELLVERLAAGRVERVPGVTISSQSGGSGGFDENDRVSMRGTNPSLTQTLVNGHAIASGDWFVLDQVGLVGRSVSFSLLPSELVSQVIVRKSATADLVEGGVAGAVDILTRRPLDFRNKLSLEAAAGIVYADLPKKADGQYN